MDALEMVSDEDQNYDSESLNTFSSPFCDLSQLLGVEGNKQACVEEEDDEDDEKTEVEAGGLPIDPFVGRCNRRKRSDSI